MRRLVSPTPSCLFVRFAACAVTLLSCVLTLRAADDSPAVATKGALTVKAALAPGAKPAAGGTVAVKVTIEPKSGWHVYANPPGVDLFRPTVLTLGPKAPAKLASIAYPKGKPLPVDDGSGDLALIYDKATTLTANLELAASLPPGETTIPLVVRFQACNDRSCLAPAEISVPLKVTVGAP